MITYENEYRDQSRSSMTVVADSSGELQGEIERLGENLLGYGMTYGLIVHDESTGKFSCRVDYFNSCD